MANRLAIAGLVVTGLTMVGVVLLLTACSSATRVFAATAGVFLVVLAGGSSLPLRRRAQVDDDGWVA